MATTKITLKEQFGMVREVLEAAGRDDLVEFVDGRIAQLEKKSASKGKISEAKLAEREAVKDKIFMAIGEDAVSASEIVTRLEYEYTIQKITSMLTAMVKTGEVVRETVKGGKVVFSVA